MKDRMPSGRVLGLDQASAHLAEVILASRIKGKARRLPGVQQRLIVAARGRGHAWLRRSYRRCTRVGVNL